MFIYCIFRTISRDLFPKFLPLRFILQCGLYMNLSLRPIFNTNKSSIRHDFLPSFFLKWSFEITHFTISLPEMDIGTVLHRSFFFVSTSILIVISLYFIINLVPKIWGGIFKPSAAYTKVRLIVRKTR